MGATRHRVRSLTSATRNELLSGHTGRPETLLRSPPVGSETIPLSATSRLRAPPSVCQCAACQPTGKQTERAARRQARASISLCSTRITIIIIIIIVSPLPASPARKQDDKEEKLADATNTERRRRRRAKLCARCCLRLFGQPE